MLSRLLRSRGPLALAMLALLLSALVIPAFPQDAPRQSRAERAAATYLVDVINHIEQHHPDGGSADRAAYIEGAKQSVIRYLEVLAQREGESENRATLAAFLSTHEFSSISSLLHVVHAFSRAYEGLDLPALADAAAQGALSVTGDPFCRILTGEDVQQLQQMMQQSEEDRSIGLVPQRNEEGEIVAGHIRRGYAALDMGFQPGDVLVAIGGTPLDEMLPEEIQAAMEADPGDALWFTIRREGFENPIELRGVQGSIRHPMARGVMLPGGIGYVYTNMFSMDLHEQVRQQIDALLEDGMRALILDLRNNPGGAMPACTGLADFFLEPGELITTTIGTYRNPMEGLAQMLGQDMGNRIDDETTEFRATEPRRYTFPMVTLVNGMSASASEMLSGCFRAHDIGTVLGEQTYGKGVGQTAIPLSTSPVPGQRGGIMGLLGGGENVRFLYMTVMTYFLPDGTEVHHHGVTPHVVVEAADPDAAIFPAIAQLRGSRVLDEIVAANWEEAEDAYRVLLQNPGADWSAVPGWDGIPRAVLAEFSADTLHREFRRAIRMRSGYLISLADDNQVQAAVLRLCGELEQDASEIPEYAPFAE